MDSKTKALYTRAFSHLVRGFMEYAVAHSDNFDEPLGDDFVLGEYFTDALKGVKGLLAGELGAQEGKDLSKMIEDIAKVANVNIR